VDFIFRILGVSSICYVDPSSFSFQNFPFPLQAVADILLVRNVGRARVFRLEESVPPEVSSGIGLISELPSAFSPQKF
jgi:hypothetical protein